MPNIDWGLFINDGEVKGVGLSGLGGGAVSSLRGRGFVVGALGLAG